jgi:hypothetical protein
MLLIPALFGPTKTTISSNSISTGDGPIARKFRTMSLCKRGRGTVGSVGVSDIGSAAAFFAVAMGPPAWNSAQLYGAVELNSNTPRRFCS